MHVMVSSFMGRTTHLSYPFCFVPKMRVSGGHTMLGACITCPYSTLDDGAWHLPFLDEMMKGKKAKERGQYKTRVGSILCHEFSPENPPHPFVISLVLNELA